MSSEKVLRVGGFPVGGVAVGIGGEPGQGGGAFGRQEPVGRVVAVAGFAVPDAVWSSRRIRLVLRPALA